MRRQDYILLSTALREAQPGPHAPIKREQHREDVLAIAAAIKEHHTKFEYEKFLNDCGVN